MSPAEAKSPAPPPKLSLQGFSAAFAGKDVLREINLDILPRERLAIIGPASSGKTTFLRSLNRLNDLDPEFTKTGRILLDGKDIYAPGTDVAALRRRIGMVYARRNKVDEEGRIKGPAISGNEKIETVALTGTGAVAGAVVAGPAGSLIGAAAGATVSAGHYLLKRHSMELPAGTVLILELNAPVRLASADSGWRRQGQ